jgi:hypothetical protein
MLKPGVCVQDTSLTAVSATMYLSGTNLWPFTADKQQIFVQALYNDIQVKPIDIRLTSDSLEQNSRRRQLLQVLYTSFSLFPAA